MLLDKRDPWDRPELNRVDTQVNESKTYSSGNLSSGYGSTGYSSTSTGYRSGSSSSTSYDSGYSGYSRTSNESLPSKVDRVCKNLNSAARSLPSAQLGSISDQSQKQGEGKKVGKGFWRGIGEFFAQDTTREVLLIMSIITLKTALIYAYVKADQKKIKVVEFL